MSDVSEAYLSRVHGWRNLLDLQVRQTDEVCQACGQDEPQVCQRSSFRGNGYARHAPWVQGMWGAADKDLRELPQACLRSAYIGERQDVPRLRYNSGAGEVLK
jgi:hypothetical protein